MLDRNGSAVDAALASLICNGLINMQSMGFGGGFLMTIYDREKKQTIVLNARDTAPAAAHTHMFNGMPKHASRTGKYWINYLRMDKRISLNIIYL
jgi:gamma-glutamyltranspeptidase/glutathione hydrolase/leukotriene-C4 hydrolase